MAAPQTARPRRRPPAAEAPRLRRGPRAALACFGALGAMAAAGLGRTSWATPSSGELFAQPGWLRARQQRSHESQGRLRRVLMRQRSRSGLDVDLLDEQQQDALSSVLRGESVFILGSAGNGKSHVLLRIIDALRDRHGDDFKDRVAVSASTGRAALQIGGTTLHDFAGCGVPYYKTDFRKMRGRRDVWTKLEVLIIDEVSMVSGEFLDYFDRELREIRKNDAPFGGLQLVCSGDPFQLVPIEQSFEDLRGLDSDELLNGMAVLSMRNGRQRVLFTNRGMFFHSRGWWELAVKTVELVTPHRQDGDAEFVKHLNTIRGSTGETNFQESIDYFNNQYCKEARSAEATILVPTVAQARQLNDGKLGELPSESRVFEAEDNISVEYDMDGKPGMWGLFPDDDPEERLRSSKFFDDESSACKVVKDMELKVGARVILASNLRLQHDRLVTGSIGIVTRLPPLGEIWVEVDFEGLGVEKISPTNFITEVPGWGTCYRRQLPLQLAWAITHHRSQGTTLSKVRMDPFAFADGLLYVALSRTRNIDDLQLMSPIQRGFIKVNQDVVTFMTHRGDPDVAQELLGTWTDRPLPNACWDYAHDALLSGTAEDPA